MQIDVSGYDSYEEASDQFEWELPKTFNIANAVCGQWAASEDGKRRVALFFEHEDGTRETYTFWQVQRMANRAANMLADLGVERGTRVSVLLPQRPETLFVNLGILQLGAISVPLSVLYGSDGLQYRLDHSGSEVVIVDVERAETLAEFRDELDDLERIVTLDDPGAIDDVRWEDAIEVADPTFETVETSPDDSAYIIYTSGTTGQPKGAHHGHRQLLGYIPGWQLFHEFPGDEAVHYSPAGWAWVGGLFAVVWTAWFHGQPVVGYGGQFDPETALDLIERYGVTNPMLTPSMLRMIREVDYDDYEFDINVVTSGGEKVTPDLADFVDEAFGVPINEVYGQTECNFLVVTNQTLMDVPRDAVGKPSPGHEIAIIDGESGDRKDTGEIGHIAIGSPDPGLLLDYWKDPERTEELFVGDWVKTGDVGSYDEDGNIYYEGRADDLIITSGYRVSPLTVENCLREHEAVDNAVVVGKPHEERGTIIKAYVKLEEEFDPAEELVADLQDLVKEREAKYKYPREVEFREEFPTTVTGKIQRHRLTAADSND